MATESTRVLHVDDDVNITDLTKTFLERERAYFEVRTATSVSEAESILSEWPVDCVVSDYEMPGCDGIALLESVREEHADLPFILYTGKGSEAVASEAISAGVTDYLQKGTGTSQYEVLANRISNVVEQYRAKRSVESTEEKLSLVAQKTDDILFMFDAAWEELLFCNDSYEEILGASIEELRADPRSFLEYVHPEDRETVIDNARSIADGEPQYTEYRMVRADDDVRWVRGHSKPVFDEDGEVDRIVGFLRDVTEQKEREAELERTKRQYDAMFNDPNILAAVLAPDGSVRNVNETAMEYIDGDLADVRGEPFGETPWWGEDDAVRTDLREWIDRAAAGEYVEFEAEIATNEGPRTVSGTFRPVTGADGTVESIIVSDRDVTERVAHERELERLWERVEFLLEATGSGIWEWNLETDVFERHGVRRLFGLPTSDAGGPESISAFLDRVHPDDRPSVEEAMERLRSEQRSHRIEFRVRHEDGEIRWLEDDAHVRSEDAGAPEAVGLVTDVTDRKRREQAIEDLHRTAQAIWTADSPEAVAEHIVESVRDILGLPANGVHLYDENDDALHPVAVTDRVRELLGEPPSFDPGEAIAWEVFESGEARVFDDVSTVPGRMNEETPFRSEMILPLGGHGVLTVGATEVSNFEATDVSLGRILAAHAASALDQIERQRRLTALQRRTQALMNTPTTQATAEVAVEAAHEILDAPASGVNLLDDSGDQLEPVAFVNAVNDEWDPPTLARPDPEATETLAWHVWDAFETGEPLVVEDVTAFEDSTLSSIPSGIVHPLGDAGVLVVTASEPGAFDEIDRTFVEILGTSLTAALDRVERETDLRERERALETQNERLEDFASIVSHDLQNPLTVAKGRVELAKEDPEGDHLQHAATALDRSESLIEDLLTLATEGEAVREVQPVALAMAAEHSWSAVDTGEATLSIESDATVLADASRIKQLLENLMRNAIEHGGADVTVSVGVLDDGFYVEDDGPGVPAEEREAVFEEGYSTATEGTGFGLSIVRRVAEAHGWEVALTDGGGGGARFEITGVEFDGQ